MAKEPTGV